METQTRLSRHNKFISVKSPFNCTIYALYVNFVIPKRINRELTTAIH